MARFPHSSRTKKRSVSKNSPRKYMHGGVAHNCPGGYMMQNGGCVPVNSGGYKKGGKVKKYSHGGGVHSEVNRTTSNPITSVNLQAGPNDGFRYAYNNMPYEGPYHIHADGTMMINAGTLGVTHEVRASEVIVQGPVNARTAVNTRARRISPNPTGSRRTTNMNRSSMSGGSSYRKGGKVRNTRRKVGGRRRLR